jgi:hypothetical protein
MFKLDRNDTELDVAMKNIVSHIEDTGIVNDECINWDGVDDPRFTHTEDEAYEAACAAETLIAKLHKSVLRNLKPAAKAAIPLYNKVGDHEFSNEYMNLLFNYAESSIVYKRNEETFNVASLNIAHTITLEYLGEV